MIRWSLLMCGRCIGDLPHVGPSLRDGQPWQKDATGNPGQGFLSPKSVAFHEPALPQIAFAATDLGERAGVRGPGTGRRRIKQ